MQLFRATAVAFPFVVLALLVGALSWIVSLAR